ncbi:MAG: helix-turn-helix domain-containing protein [Erythrobacter sp.]
MAKPQIGYIRLVSDNTSPPNRIRELREAIGMSQAELARRISITPGALQKVEVGSRKLDQQWMRRIAPVLGVTPADLLPPVDNPYSLTAEERAMIDRMRAAGKREREQLRQLADVVVPWPGNDENINAT